MSDRGTEILIDALSLPPGERAEIAERLISSLDTPDRQGVDALWATEAEDRPDAYERGEIKTIPAKQVLVHRGVGGGVVGETCRKAAYERSSRMKGSRTRFSLDHERVASGGERRDGDFVRSFFSKVALSDRTPPR